MKRVENFFELLYEKRKDLIGVIYPYDDYVNMNYKIKFNTIHGIVEMIPASLINKGASPSLKSALDKSKYFANISNEIHNYFYDYSKVVYKKNKSKVKIICKYHGLFEQSPTHHLNGHGCPKCGGSYKPNTKEFIKKAKKIHGDEYNYNLVEYINNRTKIKIVCKKHGIFRQTPDGHLRGFKCRKCAYDNLNTEGGYNMTEIERNKEKYKNTNCVLYKVRLFDNDNKESFYKIGITINDISKRMSNIPYKYEIISIYESNVYKCFYKEMDFKNKNKEFKYKPKLKFNGYTECYNKIC